MDKSICYYVNVESTNVIKGAINLKDTDWEIVYELYRNPNMTKVARLLYMTQPSLTKRLQHIESEFQVEIVNRTSKGLEFTKEGEYLAKRARIYMEFYKETQDNLNRFKTSAEENIIIGASYTYTKYTLSNILAKYNYSNPGVQFTITNEQSNILFRKVLDGSVDVAFIRGDYEGAVNKTLIGRNQAYLVTNKPVDIEMLPNMQRIGYKTNDKTKELLGNWWNERFEFNETCEMTVGYIDFAWQLIHKGLGYCCCFLPDNFENEYDLCLTPLEYKNRNKVIRNTWFVYSKSKKISNILSRFIKYIESENTIDK